MYVHEIICWVAFSCILRPYLQRQCHHETKYNTANQHQHVGFVRNHIKDRIDGCNYFSLYKQFSRWLSISLFLESLLLRHNEQNNASSHRSETIVCSTVCSCADQRKLQSPASLAFVWGTHRWPVTNSPQKRPVTRDIFPFDDVIMIFRLPVLLVYLYITTFADARFSPVECIMKNVKEYAVWQREELAIGNEKNNIINSRKNNKWMMLTIRCAIGAHGPASLRLNMS